MTLEGDFANDLPAVSTARARKRPMSKKRGRVLNTHTRPKYAEVNAPKIIEEDRGLKKCPPVALHPSRALIKWLWIEIVRGIPSELSSHQMAPAGSAADSDPPRSSTCRHLYSLGHHTETILTLHCEELRLLSRAGTTWPSLHSDVCNPHLKSRLSRISASARL